MYKNTPHINQTAEIAQTILLAGDPLRAKFISEKFLKNSLCFNKVRGALGFTGEYKDKKVSVMGVGMGMPSMGIYSYELINIFGVKNLIRIGSCGGIQDDMELYDIVFAMAASTNSNFADQFSLSGVFAPCCDFELLLKAKQAADSLGIAPKIGNILSSDTFYCDDKNANEKWKKMGVLGVEMETAALYMNAARYGAKALAIFTVSDHIFKGTSLDAESRQNAFEDMIKTALEITAL